MKSAIEWDAMRYVLGEMPPDEAIAFESLLESDLERMTAVSDAVAVIAAVRLENLPPKPAIGSSRRLNQSVVSAFWSTVALLLVLAAGQSLTRMESNLSLHSPTGFGAADGNPSAILALTWTTLRTNSQAFDLDDVDWMQDVEAPDDESSNEGGAMESEAVLPEWLQVAAGLGAGGE